MKWPDSSAILHYFSEYPICLHSDQSSLPGWALRSDKQALACPMTRWQAPRTTPEEVSGSKRFSAASKQSCDGLAEIMSLRADIGARASQPAGADAGQVTHTHTS